MMIVLLTRFLRGIYRIGDDMHGSATLRRDLGHRYPGLLGSE